MFKVVRFHYWLVVVCTVGGFGTPFGVVLWVSRLGKGLGLRDKAVMIVSVRLPDTVSIFGGRT